MPLANTREAASGSAQMLNSAAGVTFPSAIAPPISTMRSGRASGCKASSNATFVSGPIGTSVTAPSCARICSARKSTACCVQRLALRRRQVGAVEPRLAVDVRRDERLAHEWRRRAGGDGDVVASYEVENADRVRGRLLERLVSGDGGDAEQLELGRREREQQSDRVVVPGIAVEQDRRRASAAEYRVYLVRGRKRRCAPKREAAMAPAAHALRSASSLSRPSSSETTRPP